MSFYIYDHVNDDWDEDNSKYNSQLFTLRSLKKSTIKQKLSIQRFTKTDNKFDYHYKIEIENTSR